jgi:hypothetical protein
MWHGPRACHIFYPIYFNMKDRTVYSKFLLALGFILLGLYSYYIAESFTIKVWACLAVGIGYVIYGIYTYKQQRKRGAR